MFCCSIACPIFVACSILNERKKSRMGPELKSAEVSRKRDSRLFQNLFHQICKENKYKCICVSIK